MLVVGDKEQKAKTISVRNRSGNVKFGVKLDTFISSLKKDIEDRK